MGAETTNIAMENRYLQIVKERKLTSCDNDRNRRTMIIRKRRIRIMRDGSKGNI